MVATIDSRIFIRRVRKMVTCIYCGRVLKVSGGATQHLVKCAATATTPPTPWWLQRK